MFKILVAFGALVVAILGAMRLTNVTAMVEDSERKLNNLQDQVQQQGDLVKRDLTALQEQSKKEA